MRKMLCWPDGTSEEITPLTYAEFVKLELWSGASDMAYAAWLRHNKLHEISSFDIDALNGNGDDSKRAWLEIRLDPRLEPYEFNISGDGETWAAGRVKLQRDAQEATKGDRWLEIGANHRIIKGLCSAG